MRTIPFARRLLVAGLATTVLALLPLQSASARVIDADTFHDEGSFTEENFCDVAGLTVDIDFVVDGRFLVRMQGRDQLVYTMEHARSMVMYTDTATQETITETAHHVLFKDLHITDNGDGTLTIIFFGTGELGLRNDEGRLIGRNDGQFRVRIVYDVVNDEELSFELILGSTGTNSDFCESVLGEWGY
jgi:hypothetical protein